MKQMYSRRADRHARLSDRPETEPVRAVALLLPGGSVRGHRGPSRIAAWALGDLRRRLVESTGSAGIAVHLLHYRFRGWNGAAADTLADTRWALDELARRYGPVPVCLVGNSLGGRAAVEAAGHPNVTGVAGVAPWIPAEVPVEQLAGRRLLIVHGDRDHSSAGAGKSLDYALRARAAGHRVCRFEVAGAGHLLLPRAGDFWSLTAKFVLDVLNDASFDPLIAEAFGTPDGLRVPVPVGYSGER
ncbi:dienelactone hydrolase family protein [Nocardia stercoris]|uniref:Alpha/beta hydrolase n=1 Tax=Nocardia stercoris TaxID=2483361 RepID=A0A3M2L9L9_9NOCA|nr:alpha/beta hydrolase [Nocardia stercoris]RMI31268.1 alpha/beta hydrolase [Nocardia stercoris]